VDPSSVGLASQEAVWSRRRSRAKVVGQARSRSDLVGIEVFELSS
jgi:hypothetical protein